MTTRDLLTEAYDLEQSGNLIGAVELRALYHSGQQPAAPAIPSVLEQIAIEPADVDEVYILLNVTLPTGETIERLSSDGYPCDWITIKRGAAEIAIEPTGKLANARLRGKDVGDVPPEELDNLRALLSLDRSWLGSVADLGPEVTRAIKVWESLPYDEMKQIARSVGFGAWFHDPMRPRVPFVEVEAPPPAPPAPALAYEVNPRSIGYVAGGVTCLVDLLDADRAERLTNLLARISEKPTRTSAANLALIDRLLAVADEPLTPAAPTVHVEYTHDTDGSSWPTFTTGSGLTCVEISPDDDRPRIDLRIGGDGINELAEEIITHADLCQLRSNLDAILNDPRFLATQVRWEAGAPLVSIEPSICDDTVDKARYGRRIGLDCTIGEALIYIPDEPSEHPVFFYPPNENGIPLPEIERWLPQLLALLSDPRVQAERARYETASAPLMKKAA